ncbi:leucyl aminopeptidase [Streptomyces calidiresistens]|uniref:Probable cytosol aminopeptidase n=1 Tax=Streptomyces calidiresistens TaxID=1485586 RepID=A0A7W3T5U2_9ACTN|nr:leucyl aminopeptidase [Streptomyces calidiresistens]MBB0231191.1 leucyl aminopeptidase [Streptomyces calidiresistens]
MTALTLSSSTAAKVRADAVVIGVVKGEDGPMPAPGVEAAGAVDAAFGGRLTALLTTLGATGAENEITKLPAPEGFEADLVVAVGLGPASGDDAPATETLRRAAGAAARALTGTGHAAFALTSSDPAAVAAVAEGALLGSYAFTEFRGEGRDDEGKSGRGRRSGRGRKEEGRDASAPLAEVTIAGLDAKSAKGSELKAVAERAEVLAQEIARARDLVNTPPNALNPAEFAALAGAAAKEYGLKIEVLDEQALGKGGYGGIMGVGQGSQSPPRLVRLTWRHSKARNSLALIGKGITYDSGGISLKPAGSNETMKCDMAGAAAVFAAVVAAARLDLRVNVTGWLALAENMPSGSATRPGDVLTMYSGKTVEVLNTDAEGRLVMADALARAGEESPDAVVDVATLTGAMMVALGKRTFGIMSNEDSFRDLVHGIAGEVGEQAWPMPLPEDLMEGLKSPVADIANVGDRMGGGLSAGLFLKEFVADGTPWAHLDIAGPAFNEGSPFGYTPKGGTGSAVRTLVRLAERVAEEGLPG